MKIIKFEELNIWKLSLRITKLIYDTEILVLKIRFEELWFQ
jgi:hypothetical protein